MEEKNVNQEETVTNVETEQKDVTLDVEEVVEEKKYNEPITFIEEQDIFDGIESARIRFNNNYNGLKKKNALMLLPLLLLSFAGIILAKIHVAILIVTVVIVIAGFVFILKKTKGNKAKASGFVKDTIAVYFINLDTYVTSNEHFHEIKFNSDYILDKELFGSLRMIKDIIHINGRDEIIGKLDDINFIGGDYLVKTREAKEDGSTQDYLVFLGKLFVYDLPITKEGRMIIYLKGKGENGPTDVEDLQKVENALSDKYVVYASCDVDSVLKPEVKEVLETFETNEVLIDMFISIDSQRVSVGLSYNDGLMRVPLVDPLNVDELKQYKSDVDKMVNFIVELKK